MKHAIKIMAAVAVFVFAFTAIADTEKVGNYTWTYTIDGDVAYIYNGGEAAVSPLPTGSVTIPSSLGGKSKIRLGAYIFKGCSGLKNVTIPANVTIINVNTFSYCSGLESFSVTGSGSSFRAVNGLLFSANGKRLIHGVNGDVVIPDGVEVIRWDAFNRLSNLTSVTIPSSVTNIEGCAFYMCTGLKSVELPASVANIASRTFYGCTGLKDVYMSDSVTNIADRAFYGCTSLSSVTIPRSVKSIGDRAFDGSGLAQVNFDGPAGQINADFNSAFTNTAYRTTTNANDDFASAKTISGSSGIVVGLNIFATDEADEPLWNDYDDARYTMWFKWTAPSGAKAALFHTCHSDFDTVLGVYKGSSRSSLTCVAAKDDGCDNYTSKVKFAVTGGTTYYICVAGNWGRGSFRLSWATSSGTPVYVNAYGTLCGVAGDCPATLNIPSSDGTPYTITRIADEAFNSDYDPSAKNITKVTIPDSVTSVGSRVFNGCNASVFDTTTLSGVKLVDGWAVGKTSEPSGSLTLTGVRGVAGNAFSSCKNLTSLTIPSTVKGIGNWAFSYCTGLTDVIIPDSVKFLGENAFYDCNKLEGVLLPVDLCETGLESWAFGVCSEDLCLIYVDYSTGVAFNVQDDILYGVRLNGATSATIPGGVTGIEEDAFFGLTELESVTIPASVVDINPWAFDGCSALKSFTVASGNRKYKAVSGLLLTKDGKTLVNGVNGAVAIPDGVEVVGDYAFYGFGNLTSVAIPASVAEIKQHAFFYCNGLKSFTVASGNNNYKAVNGLLLTKDGKTLVNGVNGAVTIPAGVEVVGDYAFWGYDGLTSVTIPASVTQILFGAFFGCDGLTSVTIPASVTQIGDYAFEYCDGLKTVTFAGDCPDCGDYVYSGTPEGLVTYVPAGNATWAEALAAGTWKGRAIRAVPANSYTVRFHKYDGSGATADQVFKVGEAKSLLWKDSELKWSNSGYTFVGWVPWDPDKANCILCKYSNGEKVKDLGKAGDVVHLYAGWKSSYRYQVCFNRNDGTGATMIQVMLRDKDVGLAWKDSQIGWTRAGYSFKGWAESASGAVKYANGATVKNLAAAGATKQLYAVWNADQSTYTVRFNKNDGSGSTKDQTFKVGETKNLLWKDSDLKWTRSGYTFKGWAETANGAVKYSNGQSVKDIASAGATKNLYAIWQSNQATYTVRFHKYDGSGATADQVFKVGETKNLLWKDSELKWSHSGYTFVGWVPWDPDGKNCILCKYVNGEKVKDLGKAGDVVHLYAGWRSSYRYQVCFNRNDGTGATMTQVMPRDKDIGLAWKDSQIGWTRSGYTFKGWAESASGAVKYANGATVRNLAAAGATKQLYAVWTKAAAFAACAAPRMAAVPSRAVATDVAAGSSPVVPEWAAGTYFGVGENSSATITVSADGDVMGIVLFEDDTWTIEGMADGLCIDAEVVDESGNVKPTVLWMSLTDDGRALIESEDGSIYVHR